jgi:N-acetylglucosaminyldiphosphoundecaprenol N-acetyl-beta-D-mannosaminyltransferase
VSKGADLLQIYFASCSRANYDCFFLRKRTDVIGLQIDAVDFDDALGRVAELARAGGGSYVCFANVHMTIEACDDAEFANLINQADLVLPDGKPIAVLQRLKGFRRTEQIRAPSFVPRLLRLAERENLRVGFYGGKPEVLEILIAKVRREFPRLAIVYAVSPPFRNMTEAEEEETLTAINRAETQILFVGLGCPKQERWMRRQSGKISAVMLGVGAAFDFYAGTVRESPVFLQKIGLEWLFRLAQEPRRLWKRYFYTNPRFLCLAARQIFTRKQSN